MLFQPRNRFRRNHILPVKKKKNGLPWLDVSVYVLSIFLAAWLAVVVFTPSSSGELGNYAWKILFPTLGQSIYFLPPLFIYGIFAVIFRGKEKGKRGGGIVFFLSSLLLASFISSIIGVLRNSVSSSLFDGGAVGAFLAGILSRMFGVTGAALFSLVVIFAGLQFLFGISWTGVLRRLGRIMSEDYYSWMGALREFKGKQRSGNETGGSTAKKPEAKITSLREGASAEAAGQAPAVNKPVEIPRVSIKKAEAPLNRDAPAGQPRQKTEFVLPRSTMLKETTLGASTGPEEGEIRAAISKLEETLKSFGIEAHVSEVLPGPVITRYEVTPAPGVKINSIVALSNDIALAMKALGIRVIAPVPGKSAIGFEIPNQKARSVNLREILESSVFNEKNSPLTIAMGLNSDGTPAVANLEKMPHLLVAGATNSGKSVFLHSLILSIIFRNTPDEVKFLMIDPKRLELTFYDSIPHLYDPLTPCEQVAVITNPKEAAASLKKLTRVMEERYIRFEFAKVKNIESYNRWAAANGQPPEFYIVVVIDELADLMMQEQNVVESSIQRLSQMARAVGIHLVLATQRPSVDIITGVIKANLPSRVALQVTSKTDSRVILDSTGADALLGKGDLLYLAPDAQKPVRMQGAYVTEDEITKVADFLRAQARPYYPPPFEEKKEEDFTDGKGASPEEFRQALKLVLERRRVSQDLLKAHFGSSARATNILSILEMRGYIRKPEGSNRWEIFFDKIEETLRNPEPEGNKEEVA